MEQKETAIIMDGKKYEYRKGKYNGATEACEACALREKCKENESDVLCNALGVAQDSTSNFQLVDNDDEGVNEEKVYNYYQERSVTAGSRADQLAWMFIIMMTGGLISGHAYETFSVCAALSAIYLFFSIMQAVWQTFTSWLFLQMIKDSDTMPDDYPAWVGGGAWLFFWLKMITISGAVFYFVRAIIE